MARALFRMVLGMKQHPQSWAERQEDLETRNIIREKRGLGALPALERPSNHKPSDHELLYPGDEFEVEEMLLRQGPPLGWLEPVEWTYNTNDGRAPKRDAQGRPLGGGQITGVAKYDLRCAVKVRDLALEDEVVESRTLRDEPSDIRGINISEKDYDAKHETEATPASNQTDLTPVRPDLPRRSKAGVR